jgi:hypothetical protein
MVGWECPTNPREASGLDPEAVHPSVIWTAFALVVVVVGLGELAADGATD